MVKLASGREKRMYGGRKRSEYMNAGVYVLATILLTGGFAAQLSGEPKSGLALLLIGFGIIMIVNLHDLIAHLAPIDYRLPTLMDLDLQLALVEFAVPLLYIFGTILFFLPTLFLFIQAEKGYSSNLKLERVGVSMLIGGPLLWVVGSIHNSCQIYERGDAHLQILQHAVLVPFLMASLLFLLGAIENTSPTFHVMLGQRMIWLGIFGSLILFVGGLANVVKVFKMQQMNGLRLEKLRGGAQDRLLQLRQGGHMPLITNAQQQQEEEERGRRWMIMNKDDHYHQLRVEDEEEEEEGEIKREETSIPTPYKDALVAKP